MTKIIAISDTHGFNLRTKVAWPKGDILIHAGDGTARGLPDQIKLLGRQLLDLPYRYRVYIPGNHDKMFRHDPVAAIALMPGIITLIDEGVELMGLRIYGMPWLPNNSGTCSHAFETDDLMIKTYAIPADTDILVTHTPPYDILDGAWRNWIKDGHDQPSRLLDDDPKSIEHMGNRTLANRLSFDSEFGPKLIVSGHVHEAYGQDGLDKLVYGDDTHHWDEQRHITIVNASLCNHDYELTNKPWEIEL